MTFNVVSWTMFELNITGVHVEHLYPIIPLTTILSLGGSCPNGTKLTGGGDAEGHLETGFPIHGDPRE